MNKGCEVIEAVNLFGIAPEQVTDYLREVRAVLAENADVLAEASDAQVNV